MARTKVAAVPEVGNEAPEFHLPSAQGGQLRLSMRTARGPVVVVFYRGLDFEEDIEYFKELAQKEDEINLAAGSVVGIGLSEPDEAREFVRKSGIKSYVLYDYTRAASRDWGLLEKDKKLGEYVRPAVFIVGTDREVVHAWVDERPDPAEILAKVSEITGLPKPPEEEDEAPKKPKRAKAEGDADAPDTPEKPERQKLTPEEREKRRAERKAARESEEKPVAEKPEGEKDSQAGDEVKPSAREDGSGPEAEESKKAGE